MWKKTITVLLAGCASGLFAYADSNAQLSASDRTFLQSAAQGGLAEVQLGQLAEQKAWAPSVQNFARRMVLDHRQINERLKGVAAVQGVTLPDWLNASDMALYKQLSGLSAQDFDTAYIRAMVSDHEQDTAAFRKELAATQDPGVSAFISMTLPTLEEHLQRALEVRTKLGINATSEANGIDEAALQR